MNTKNRKNSVARSASSGTLAFVSPKASTSGRKLSVENTRQVEKVVRAFYSKNGKAMSTLSRE